MHGAGSVGRSVASLENLHTGITRVDRAGIWERLRNRPPLTCCPSSALSTLRACLHAWVCSLGYAGKSLYTLWPTGARLLTCPVRDMFRSLPDTACRMRYAVRTVYPGLTLLMW